MSTYRDLLTDDAIDLQRVTDALRGTGPDMPEREVIAILVRAIRNLQVICLNERRKTDNA